MTRFETHCAKRRSFQDGTPSGDAFNLSAFCDADAAGNNDAVEDAGTTAPPPPHPQNILANTDSVQFDQANAAIPNSSSQLVASHNAQLVPPATVSGVVQDSSVVQPGCSSATAPPGGDFGAQVQTGFSSDTVVGDSRHVLNTGDFASVVAPPQPGLSFCGPSSTVPTLHPYPQASSTTPTPAGPTQYQNPTPTPITPAQQDPTQFQYTQPNSFIPTPGDPTQHQYAPSNFYTPSNFVSPPGVMPQQNPLYSPIFPSSSPQLPSSQPQSHVMYPAQPNPGFSSGYITPKGKATAKHRPKNSHKASVCTLQDDDQQLWESIERLTRQQQQQQQQLQQRGHQGQQQPMKTPGDYASFPVGGPPPQRALLLDSPGLSGAPPPLRRALQQECRPDRVPVSLLQAAGADAPGSAQPHNALPVAARTDVLQVSSTL